MGGGEEGLDEHCYSFLSFKNGITDLGYGKLEWSNTQPSTIYPVTNIDGHKYVLALNLENRTATAHSSGLRTSSGSQNFDILQNPFTIDFWNYRTFLSGDDGSNPSYAGHGTTSFCAAEYNNKNTVDSELVVDIIIGFGISDNMTASIARAAASPWPPSSNMHHDLNIDWMHWTHLAISFDGSIFYLFKNGQLINTFPLVDRNKLLFNNFAIGIDMIGENRTDWSRYLFHGYMDKFRISDICRWTTNFDINTMYY